MRFLLVISILLIGGNFLFAEGVFSPLSGINGQAGHEDGSGNTAVFNDPTGLARDAAGNLYICDSRNHVIRKISPNGVVSTLAGEPGTEGAVDGMGRTAHFRFPADIAVSADGVLFVADSGNHCIRKIATNGMVTTIAGDLGSADDVFENHGTEFSTVSRNLDGTGTAARFKNPGGIALAVDGGIYVSDTGNHIIRRIDTDGKVTTVAGKSGEWGAIDGAGSAARFYSPIGMCVGADGNIYIADSGNHTIRCMTAEAIVTTFAGNPAEHGCKGGSRLDARLSAPTDIAAHPDGGFIICESFGNTLLRLDSGGMVSIFAGGLGESPQTNKLSNPSSAVCDDFGNVYVTDTFNQEIRLIIEKFEMSISNIGADRQLTITWDSLPGRDYQLQILVDDVWGNADLPGVRAVHEKSHISFPLPNTPTGIYRILLLGF